MTFSAPNETGKEFVYDERDLVKSIHINHKDMSRMTEFEYKYVEDNNCK